MGFWPKTPPREPSAAEVIVQATGNALTKAVTAAEAKQSPGVKPMADADA